MRIRFATLALLAGASAPLAAQQPAADTARRIPGVTVTAQRTGRDPERAALATTTLKASDWQARLGLGLQDALNLAPGVLAQSRSGGMDIRIAIRGFGARGAGDRSNAGTTRGVRFVVDGIPETEPDGRTSLDLVDLWASSSVEVVRSNASALWGNASGGLVSLTTLPGADQLGTTVRTLFGSYGYQRNLVQAASASGRGVVSATVVTTKYDGFRGNSSNERQLVSAGFQSAIGDATRLGVTLLGSNNLFFVPGPLTDAEFAADPNRPNATYASRLERRWNRIGRVGLTVDHQIDESQSLSAMAYVTPKFLQRSERGTFRDFNRTHTGLSAAYALDGTIAEGVTHRLTTGFDFAFQDGTILFYSLSASGGRGTTLRDNKREGASNLGLYVQEEITRGPWALTFGLRNDNIQYDYQSFITPRLDASKSFSGLIPKLGISYKLGDGHVVYANVGGGIEVPAGNETDPASTFGQDTVTAINPLLEPIRSTTWEVGTRRTLGAFSLWGLGIESLSYDAAAYYIDVTNEVVPYRGGRFYFTAGQARRMGLELGVRASTAFGLTLTGAGSISDNRYTSYVVDSVHYGRPGQLARFDDNRIVGVPRWTGNLQADWRLGTGFQLAAGLGVQATGGYSADDANKVGVPALNVWNATLRSGDLITNDGITISGAISVENLFDRKYAASAFLNPDVVGGVPVYLEPGMPRSLLVTFEVRRK
jgi:iron complex outermembrane receptor protein